MVVRVAMLLTAEMACYPPPAMILSAVNFNPEVLGKSKVSPWLMAIAYPLCQSLLPRYFRRIQITGQEHIPHQGPVIIAPTHRSRWDALLVSLALGRGISGRDLRFMVTATEVTGIQGWFIRRLGGFPVDLKRVESSSLIYSVALLQQGEMLVIFPEGGIFRDRQVHRLKRGIARIALEVVAQEPTNPIQILPVAIDYDDPYQAWGCGVQIRIGQGIKVNQFDPGVMKTSSEALTQALWVALQEINENQPAKVLVS